MTNSVFNTVATGPWFSSLVNATVTACYNTITNSVESIMGTEVYNSKITICGNRIVNVAYDTGIWWSNSGLSTLPSTVYIRDNQVLNASWGATAIWMGDWGSPYLGGPASTLNAVVSGNVFQTNTNCGCYNSSDPLSYSVIVSYFLKSFVVSQNTILGGGAAGIFNEGGPGVVSDNTITGSNTGIQVHGNSTRVTGNVIKSGAQWGIAITSSSFITANNNLVAWNLIKNSGAFDLYWDQTGTGNVWHGNLCQTSSPPGLC